MKIFHFSLGERLVYFNNEGLLQTRLVWRRGRSPELKKSSSSLFMCAIRFEGLGRKKVSCLGSLAHGSKHLESLIPRRIAPVLGEDDFPQPAFHPQFSVTHKWAVPETTREQWGNKFSLEVLLTEGKTVAGIRLFIDSQTIGTNDWERLWSCLFYRFFSVLMRF